MTRSIAHEDHRVNILDSLFRVIPCDNCFLTDTEWGHTRMIKSDGETVIPLLVAAFRDKVVVD